LSKRGDEYRANAARCAERADEARDPEVKRQLQDLIRQWIEIAHQADEIFP
jgi:hypothetical protein